MEKKLILVTSPPACCGCRVFFVPSSARVHRIFLFYKSMVKHTVDL